MKIKEKFPDSESLKEYLRTNSVVHLDKIRSKVGHLEEEYVKSLWKSRVGGGFIFVGAILAFGMLDESLKVPFNILVWSLVAGIILVVIGAWLMRGTASVITNFNYQLNRTIYEIAFAVFALDAKVYTTDPLVPPVESDFEIRSNYESVTSLLNKSELITENRNVVISEDRIQVVIDEHLLSLVELDVKNVTGSGKNKRVKNIFKGYLAVLTIDSDLKHKTFVSTEGDRRGFGHKSFWKDVQDLGSKDVEFESNDFEKLLHVSSTDPVEARYILTPDFMMDLYTWWSGKKKNIRISFIGNKMSILFPDKRVRIRKTVNSLSSKNVSKYLEVICLPLMHIVHMAEDVN